MVGEQHAAFLGVKNQIFRADQGTASPQPEQGKPVELGQLAIVGVFFPIAWLLRHTLFYRWVVVTGGSLAVAVLGTLWTLERTGLYKF